MSKSTLVRPKASPPAAGDSSLKNSWSDAEANRWIKDFASVWGKDVALQAYASKLIGRQKDLVLYGGGNTSVKAQITDILGEKAPALFVKASGLDMAGMQDPSGFVALNLDGLLRLKKLRTLNDEAMADQFRLLLAKPQNKLPSLETLLHAFLPARTIDHTHPAAILALTNREDAGDILRDALGNTVTAIPYVRAGMELAHAVDEAFRKRPKAADMVLMQHGLITWGNSAKEAYERTLEIVYQADKYLARHKVRTLSTKSVPSTDEARKKYIGIAPLLRGLMSPKTQDPDRPHARMILVPVLDKDTLCLVSSSEGKALALSAPLTPDYLIRVKAKPLWVDNPNLRDPDVLRNQIADAIRDYEKGYAKRAQQPPSGDNLPRVIYLPGLGAVCAGRTPFDAALARDIITQEIQVKILIHETGGKYKSLPEDHLLDMEFRAMQRAKVDKNERLALTGSVALVTGAAGAIGSGICRALLSSGCAVAATDLPGEHLDNFVGALQKDHPDQIAAIPLDVTDAGSVARGFDAVVEKWGGIDLVVVNAGAAHVSTLAQLDVESFRNLERVNVEGTLLVLSEAARRFKLQNMGGDIVVISTKNVFAPGASFGAYSATKAASHQLARIASLELAEIGVRVNMIAPDAVFSNGDRKSGLWAKVGPDRMKARGLDGKGLQDYYQNRNLLKAKITADHVGRAVLFFATRQTPTTGATLPVDGGLPDATPR